ncbi:unnamed protein product [Chondrus crispus]|uniref:Uncharacterized protein n=1 Tax=Chondrus crispus TaxID=2769 RepID=R7QTH5_CHOCR|nr:unnamed protein product [Chondrus crispus]CDF40680.1 unnamed protein product [Chondrus crispus]|eukprot:XP_005710974.1 unnamed protein product [Chondrus crispus]
MLLTQQDACEPARIIALYEEAIQTSVNSTAKINLAIILADGWGVDRDLHRSRSLIEDVICLSVFGDDVSGTFLSDEPFGSIYRLALLYEMSKDAAVHDIPRAAELY